MTRSTRPSLRCPPPSAQELEEFPIELLAPNVELWRLVKAGRPPWWFGNSMEGRFDLPSPDGTCYVASDQIGAFLEVFGPDIGGGVVDTADIIARAFRSVGVPTEHTLGDFAHRRAAKLGVTLEIHTIVPYICSQEWALALRGIGKQGLRYLLRHDASAAVGYAIFSEEGLREDWPHGHEEPISQEFLEELESQCGITASPPPSANQVRLRAHAGFD